MSKHRPWKLSKNINAQSKSQKVQFAGNSSGPGADSGDAKNKINR
jgi:hypothetical protein